MDYTQQLQQVMKDPQGMAKKAGFEIPEGMDNDPRAIVMHLIQTGQVSSPLMQRIMPMIQKLNGK